ncbi:MAG: hypothetical protein ACJAT7_003374 [Psychromonas sp.]|jgi:hypothetical protein
MVLSNNSSMSAGETDWILQPSLLATSIIVATIMLLPFITCYRFTAATLFHFKWLRWLTASFNCSSSSSCFNRCFSLSKLSKKLGIDKLALIIPLK